MMKRVASGVLAVLMFVTCMFAGVTAVYADPANDTQTTGTEGTTITNEKVTEPTTKPTESATKPTESATKPTESATKPTEPATKPTEPATKPTEPATKPTEPATKPTEPATKPTESTTAPTEPEEKPTQPQDPERPRPEKLTYSGRTISEEGMLILKKEEGFSEYPYWDYSQYTVGYGTRCPDDLRAYYTKNGITEEDAEILLNNHLIGIYKVLNNFESKNSLSFTQNQFDALVLFSYNCGTGWTNDAKGTLPKALKNKATGNDLIRAFGVWCSAGGEIKTFLLRRRLSESYMYLEGQYAQNPPANYCYVIYNPNGGTTSPKSQTYNSDTPIAPYPVPTYDGHTFLGWYTQKNGGTKVTSLDASTKSKTLYAHWQSNEGEEEKTEETAKKTTVTANDVNVRSGPGTNYTRVGSKNKGDKIEITEVASGSGYRWGKFSGGWICLQYTDYDSNVGTDTDKETNTNPDKNTTTGTTTDKNTNTNTDKDTNNENNATADKTLTGIIVNCSEWLRIRSGAGTNHAINGYLYPGDKVTITETTMVGSTKWGKIDRGWISMDYVKLVDNSDSGSTGNTGSTSTTQSKTGTVTTNDLRIRSGAGTANSVLGYLQTGNKVTITQTTVVNGTTWGKISKGWISMDYVKLDNATGSAGSTNNSSTNTGTSNNSGTANNSGTTTQTQTGTVVNCSSYLNVRSGAGTSYSVAGYLYPGDKVTITETKMVGSTKWGKMSKGWVSMDYIKLGTQTQSSASDAQTKTVTASCLCVRKTAGNGTVVSYLYYGTKVSIIETTTVNGVAWGRISAGWICMTYTK